MEGLLRHLSSLNCSNSNSSRRCCCHSCGPWEVFEHFWAVQWHDGNGILLRFHFSLRRIFLVALQINVYGMSKAISILREKGVSLSCGRGGLSVWGGRKSGDIVSVGALCGCKERERQDPSTPRPPRGWPGWQMGFMWRVVSALCQGSLTLLSLW